MLLEVDHCLLTAVFVTEIQYRDPINEPFTFRATVCFGALSGRRAMS